MTWARVEAIAIPLVLLVTETAKIIVPAFVIGLVGSIPLQKISRTFPAFAASAMRRRNSVTGVLNHSDRTVPSFNMATVTLPVVLSLAGCTFS